jgi:hypothetical protein
VIIGWELAIIIEHSVMTANLYSRFARMREAQTFLP